MSVTTCDCYIYIKTTYGMPSTYAFGLGELLRHSMFKAHRTKDTDAHRHTDTHTELGENCGEEMLR